MGRGMILKIKYQIMNTLPSGWKVYRFDCPHCGAPDSFTINMVSPYHCWRCGGKYPPMSDMIGREDTDHRKHFYMHAGRRR